MLFAYLLQQNVFPDRGTVYDFYFVKQASGSWNNWIDRVDKAKNVIPKDAKVNMSYPVNNSNGQLLPTQLFSLRYYTGTSCLQLLGLAISKINYSVWFRRLPMQ